MVVLLERERSICIVYHSQHQVQLKTINTGYQLALIVLALVCTSSYKAKIHMKMLAWEDTLLCYVQFRSTVISRSTSLLFDVDGA